MKSSLASISQARSRGFVLMAAVLLLGVVSMAVLLSSLSSSNAATQQAIKTQLALKEAKEAVLGYILLDAPETTLKPGRIPCPDRDNDNDSDPADNSGNNCGGSYLNRLPGKNLRIGELRDSGNEKLWYAISPGFRDGSLDAVNSLTPTTLTIDGQGEYVAVVLAPGAPLPAQTRSTSSTRTAYLEEGNASGTANLVTFRQRQENESEEQAKTKFNDRVLGISKKEWEDTILRRVSAEVVKAINKNKAGAYFPWATPLSNESPPLTVASSPADPWMGVKGTLRGLLPARKLWPPLDENDKWPKQQPWQSKNEWHQLFYYVIAPAFADGKSASCIGPNDCLTLRHGSTQTTDIKALVVYAGPRRDGQSRPSTDLTNYLEGAENQDLDDNVFEVLPAAISNDRFYIIK